MTKTISLLLATALSVATPALAQDLYFGGGLGYSSGTSEPVGGGIASDLDAGMLTLVLGQRFAAGTGFWGWETSADLSFGAETKATSFDAVCATDGAGAPYLCKHDATLRVVGIYGAPVAQGMEVYGSLGLGMMLGDYANSENTTESAATYGLTVGVGLNRDFGNGLIGRGEIIYDNFNRNTQEFYDSDYQGTSIRFGILRSF